MGYWGTDILSNDYSADIKDSFFALYDKGDSFTSIVKTIKGEFIENENLVDNTNFWLTLALLEWQVGNLSSDVKILAEKIIDEGLDLQVWKGYGADEATLLKRETELFNFRIKLQTPNRKPRAQKEKKFQISILKKGEVFAFPLDNGYFSVVIVLEEVIDRDFYFLLIANTDIYKVGLPSLEDVMKSGILIKSVDPYEPAISCYSNSKYKGIVTTFIKLGDVVVKKDYKSNYLSYGMTPWSFMLEWANKYLNKGKPDKSIPVSNYIKTSAGWLSKIFVK